MALPALVSSARIDSYADPVQISSWSIHVDLVLDGSRALLGPCRPWYVFAVEDKRSKTPVLIFI
jgi:hypothetical protein